MQLNQNDKESFLAPITSNIHLSALSDKHSGLDMNNLIGTDLQEIRDLCNQSQTSPPYLKAIFLPQIHSKKQKVLKFFKIKLNKILEYQKKILAVFDGSKTNKIKQIKPFIENERKAKRVSQRQAIGYLKGSQFIEYTFLKNQYNPNQNSLYWSIYDTMIETLAAYLIKLGAKVLFAPYQADIQLIKFFEFGFIDFVFSNDKDYVNYGVPLLSNLQLDGKVQLISVSANELSQNRWNSPYRFIKIARENPMKQAMFAALNGSKHLSKIKSFCGKFIPTALLIELIEHCQNLSEVFKILRANYKNFIIPRYYQELAEATMIVHLLSPYYNPNSKKVEFADQKKFDMIKDRKLNLQNLSMIWNQNYSEQERKGIVNVNYNLVRQMVVEQLNKKS